MKVRLKVVEVEMKGLLLALAFAAFFGGNSGDLRAEVPKFAKNLKDVCVFLSSPRVSSQVVSAGVDYLDVRFSGACEASSENMDDPFSPISSERWNALKAKYSYALWVDVTKDQKDVVVRGFDLAQGLQWGQAKATTSGILEDSLTSVIVHLLDQVIDQLPVVGWIEGGSFFSWSKAGFLKVVGVNPAGVVRHPYLPYVLRYQWTEVSGTEAHLKAVDEKTWTFRFLGDKPPLMTSRVYLKKVTASEQ